MTENPLHYLNEIGKELNTLRLKVKVNEQFVELYEAEISKLKGLLEQCLDHPVKPEVIAKVKRVIKS